MVTLTDVFRQYGGAYLDTYGDRMPAVQRKAMAAIMACRTGELGWAIYGCDRCGAQQWIPQSCGNRHCPTCQGHQAHRWLEQQLQRLLPCPYFLVTFTVPESIRRFVRSHPQAAYGALFEASVYALRTLAAESHWIGAERIGMFGVLHTWGRQLSYHPHIHFVIPGGGLTADGRDWRPSRAEFFLPVKALSMLYRAKFRQCMQRDGLLGEIDPVVWREAWIVDSRAVGDGGTSLQYLAPYVFRVAISNGRILSCQDGKVVFLWKKSGSHRWRRMVLEAFEFIRRFLEHVLPTGFMKVRHFGFLSAASSLDVEHIRELITEYYGGFAERLAEEQSEQDSTASGPLCPQCGAPMRLRAIVLPDGRDAVAIHDSG